MHTERAGSSANEVPYIVGGRGVAPPPELAEWSFPAEEEDKEALAAIRLRWIYAAAARRSSGLMPR